MTPSSKIRSWLGQLTDLKAGHLSEIVIKNGQDAEDLKEVLGEALKEVEGREQMEREHDLEEESGEEIDKENKGVPSVMDEAERLGATQDKDGNWSV